MNYLTSKKSRCMRARLRRLAPREPANAVAAREARSHADLVNLGLFLAANSVVVVGKVMRRRLSSFYDPAECLVE